MKRVRVVVSIVLLGVLSYFTWQLVDFDALTRLTLGEILSVAAVIAALIINQNYMMYLILGSQKIHLRTTEWLGLGVYTSLVNLVVPFRSGLALKAVYLKRVYGLNYAEFLGLQGVYNLLYLLNFVGSGLALTLLFSPGELRMLIPMLVAFVGLLGLLVLGRFPWKPSLKPLRLLWDAYEAFHEVRSDRRLVFRMLANVSVTLALMTAALYLAMSLMDVEGTLLHSIFINIIVTIGGLIQLTPGNIGVAELLGGLSSEYLQLDFEKGVLAMVLLRAVSIVVHLLMAPLFLGLVTHLRARD